MPDKFTNLYRCPFHPAPSSQLLCMVFFFCLFFIGCQNSKTHHPTKNELLLLAVAYNYQQSQNSSDCKTQYKNLNSLYQAYFNTEFVNYPTSCENIIIGDSTMDLARTVTTFYDKTKTYNYAVSGNTACDYLYQMEAIKCNPKNVLIATGDGNGLLKKVASGTSIDTMKKVTARIKEKWNANIAIIGIHPVLLTNENIAKNAVNAGVSQLGYCYINPLPIFGVGENDPPDSSVMLDQIHYNVSVYPKYKAQITSQCSIIF